MLSPHVCVRGVVNVVYVNVVYVINVFITRVGQFFTKVLAITLQLL